MNTGKSTAFFQEYEGISLVVSVLLHAVILLILLLSNAPHPPPVQAIEVTIEPLAAVAPKQIVSPSEQLSTTPPLNTARLSDADSRTDIEKIRRGDNGGAPGPQAPQTNAAQVRPDPSSRIVQAPKPQPPATSNSKQPEPATKKPSSTESKRDLNLKDLKLDDATLSMKFGTTPQRATQQRQSSSQSQSLSEYQAFSRPPGSGAAFLGNSGISDHLPNLPDGDITLLNAKANTYAGFVRRVAIRVFTQLRTQGWERLSQQQIQRLNGFATIEAILSPDGKFLKAQLLESSGSDAFDSVVNLSVSSGAADPNPPEGARASDGNIHFIFRARSWSQLGTNRRSGAPMEQRWLLLATGLE